MAKVGTGLPCLIKFVTCIALRRRFWADYACGWRSPGNSPFRPVVGHERPNSGRSILLRPSQIVKQMCQCLFACLLAQTHVVEFAFR